MDAMRHELIASLFESPQDYVVELAKHCDPHAEMKEFAETAPPEWLSKSNG
jgi:hypothetical protein